MERCCEHEQRDCVKIFFSLNEHCLKPSSSFTDLIEVFLDKLVLRATHGKVVLGGDDHEVHHTKVERIPNVQFVRSGHQR